MDAASRAAHAFVLVGTARLPKMLSGDDQRALLVELSLDAEGRIVDVATTLPLPGYAALLRSVFIGHQLDGVEPAVAELSARLRGALLRPTIAAVANALSQMNGVRGN